MSVSIDGIIKFFEDDFADIRRQASWDFSGKQIYLGNREVTEICLALDPSKSVIEQAISRGCGLLITHHPLFFTPMKGVNIAKTKDSTVINAIKNNLSILSYHTNLDMAPEGVNAYLLKLLNAENEGLLSEEGEIEHVKLTVFTPITHEDAVLDAIDQAGGGHIGNYRRCAFSVKGTGTFIPLEGSNPYRGSKGEAEKVEEVRQEVIIPAKLADSIVTAMKKAHPYETPAFETTPVRTFNPFGFGNIAKLSKKHTLNEFVTLLKEKFNLNTIRVNMDEVPPFDRFAVSSGSGGTMWKECRKHGVNVLVTGDLKHHDALDAKEAGIFVADIGHFVSEQIYLNFLADILRKKFNVDIFLADEKPTIFDI